jgi:hypothetical protein
MRREGPLWSLWRESGPVQTLTLDIGPPELCERIFVFFFGLVGLFFFW